MKRYSRILVVDKSVLLEGMDGVAALPPDLRNDEINLDWILVSDNGKIWAIKSRNGRGGAYSDQEIIAMIRDGDVNS